MDVRMMQYPPGDSRMIDKIVHQLKSQGIFDQFRKECIADVDTKPAYQNLHQRVEGTVSGFLASQVWQPDLNKNQLRDSLRKHIHESGFLDIGVERIVDQVVNPKILTVFMPQVEDVVYKFLGIEKPKKGKENQNVSFAPSTFENTTRKEERKLPTLTDLLPKELEPISPESDTLKDDEYNSDEAGEVGLPGVKEEEDSSPPFEPIEEVHSRLGESSVDSHLSGISELTSHDSQHSHVSFDISNYAHENNTLTTKLPAVDVSNNDSQLSKVSSGSRLSIVSLCEQDSKLSHDAEVGDDSQQSDSSLHISGQDTQMSVSMEFTNDENEVKGEDSQVSRDIFYEDTSIFTSKWQTYMRDSSHIVSDCVTSQQNSTRGESITEEKKLDEKSEKEFDDLFERMCNNTPTARFVEEYKNKNVVFGYKSDENEDIILADKCESKSNITNDEKPNEIIEKTFEKNTDGKSERRIDKRAELQNELKSEEIYIKKENEKSEKISDDDHGRKVEKKYENISDENLERKLDEKHEAEVDEKSERRLEEKPESKSGERSERKLDDKFDRKSDEKSARRLDEKFEKKQEVELEGKLMEKPEEDGETFEWKLDDKKERKSDEKSERKCDEKSEKRSDEKLERKLVEKERKLDEKSEKKCDEKFERKLVEKYEGKLDEKAEKKSERKCDDNSEWRLVETTERKSVEMSEKRSDEKLERKMTDKPERKPEEKSERKSDEKLERKLVDKPERKPDEQSEKKSDEKLERKLVDKSGRKPEEKSEKKSDEKLERKLVEKTERKSEEKSEKKSDEKLERKLVEKPERKPEEQSEKKSDEKLERKLVERLERKPEEKSEKKSDEKLERKLVEKTERKSEEKSEKKSDEKLERKLVEKPERKPEEKSEKKSDEKLERKLVEKTERKSEEKSEKKSDEKLERKLVEKPERKPEEKSEKKSDEKLERKLVEKTERNSEEKSEKKSDEKLERKLAEKSERKPEEKSEKKSDEKLERKLAEKSERKPEEKSEKKSDEKLERKLVEKTERKSDEKSEKITDEKLESKLVEKSERKPDEKSERRLDEKLVKKSDEKSGKKLDIKLMRKTDEKHDKKLDTKLEKKVEDKHDKKHEKHREDRDKARVKKEEKKQLNSESKDTKKNDSSGHSSEGDRKRSDKDRNKRNRGDSRSRAEKSNKDGKEKTEKDGVKEKVEHEEKSEKVVMKEESKQEVKENKDEKEKKVGKDSSKEKSKKEDGAVSRHEKDTKKPKSDEKRERDQKVKPKPGEKGQLKHGDKHKDRSKSENRDKSDKDKSAQYDDKNSKDSSRSSSKESRDRVKHQETKDKGKDAANKNYEKKGKDKSKHGDKTSKTAEKGSTKKADRKKKERDSTKSLHTDHKSKDSGKKGKEKGKSVSDDHRIHRDKHSGDRRSTDRDSNGTPQDRSLGSTTSRTNGNDSQCTQSHHNKSGGSSNSSKSDSGGNSDSSGASTQAMESSKNVEENVPSSSKSASPPSSLPFKKRPVSVQSDDELESTHSRNGKLSRSKIKKPKIAANIFEVKKIMMLRKSLAKKERKQQRELQKNKNIKEGVKEMKKGKKVTKPVVAKRRKLGDIEKSLRNEIDTSLSNKQMPEVQNKKDNTRELKYFESELIPTALSRADSDFLAYVKQLVECDNLSEISTSSDSASERSDVDDIIHLPSCYLDDIVAAELGAKIVQTDKGTEVILDLPEDRELSKEALPSLNSTIHRSLCIANKNSTVLDPFSVAAPPEGAIVFIDSCDDTLRNSVEERTDLRSVSAHSSSSDTSADDMLDDRRVKRVFGQCSSSVVSTNCNKNTCDRIEVSSNGLGTGKAPDCDSKLHRKRVFSKRRVKKEAASVSEMKPPEVAGDKWDLRRARKPNTRYSDKMFASCLEEEDLSRDAFSEERDNIILDDGFPTDAVNDVSTGVPDRANSVSPLSLGGNKICFRRMKVPATITQADDGNSDREIVSEPLTGDAYYIIKDNNNIDKGSSEDERGCGDGSMLNQDLILPTLRDLMVESGFRREDDKSDILPSSVNVGNSVGDSLLVTGNDVSTVRSAHEVRKGPEKRQQKLGRSRRVGLGRPPPRRSSGQVCDDDAGNRTPPPSNVADFVMPLSPESDVSASSGEAKKPMLHSKVGDSHTDPSPSNSDKKDGQMSNSRIGDTEIKRNLRSGGIGTPGGRAQRYSSDDLYKPRPLFSQCSRRVRGHVSSSLSQEAVANCTGKRHGSDVTEALVPSSKRRR